MLCIGEQENAIGHDGQEPARSLEIIQKSHHFLRRDHPAWSC